MDDILLAHSSSVLLQQAFALTVKVLKNKGLIIAPDKIQAGDLVKFLGSIIQNFTIVPQKIRISTQHLQTLNDYQKLLGDINRLRGFLKLPRSELLPLFKTLEGNPDVNSFRQLTPAVKEAINKVEKALEMAQVLRFDPSKELILCVLKIHLNSALQVFYGKKVPYGGFTATPWECERCSIIQLK